MAARLRRPRHCSSLCSRNGLRCQPTRCAGCRPRPSACSMPGFASAPRWLELRARGVHELPQRGELAYFDEKVARSITRRMLVYGWHLARSRPRAACLVFGSTIDAVESLAACSLVALEAAAERNADALRPRWSSQFGFWRALLVAASDGADHRLHELLLGGLQRLAAETLAAHDS
jgi:hypothetical protein